MSENVREVSLPYTVLEAIHEVALTLAPDATDGARRFEIRFMLQALCTSVIAAALSAKGEL